MTTPPDDKKPSPGASSPPGSSRDGSRGSTASPSTPQAGVSAHPQDALAQLLDRRSNPDGGHAEALLRALVDASPLAMWVLDPEGRVLVWNHGAERLTGWTADEVLGRPVPTVPADKTEEFRELFGRTLRKQAVVDAEVRRQKKDGSPVDLSVSSAPLVAGDGTVVAVLVMAADLTARKEAEETARRLASERAAREAIHERKRAEAALHESEARFRSTADALRESEHRYRRIFDTVEVSIWEEDFSGVKAALDALRAEGVTDIRGYFAEHPEFVARAAALVKVCDVNDASLAMFGAQDKSELLASLDRVFLPETLNVFAEEVAAMFEGRTRLQSETPGRTLAGEPMQLAFSVAFPSDDPQLRSVLVSMLDITDRKRVEAERERLLGAERAARERIEQLQAVTAALVEAVTVEDVADSVVETVRRTTTARSATLALLTADGSEFEVIRMMGLPEDQAAKWRRFPVDAGLPSTHAVRTGEPVFLHSLDEMSERFPKLVDGARENGFAASAVLPLVVAGTRVGTLGLNYATPQPFDAGKRAYLAAVAQQCAQALERARLFEAERTARAESERARRDADTARTAAEQASRAKSDFLATMSHELRTPLNAIIGYESLLADGVTGPVSDGQRRQLERIGASAHHLLMLIDEVLTLSRVEAGKEVVHIEPVEIAVVLDEAGTIIEPLAKQKSLAFQAIGPPDRITMQSDPGKLRQAIVNLLSNAIKFTGRGSVTLRASEAGADVIFEVRDTGIGIAAEHLERIFEPFWQVEASTTRTAPGTGLGLAVTRRLAHLLGGEVTVKSAVGEGSTFTLRVPRAGPAS